MFYTFLLVGAASQNLLLNFTRAVMLYTLMLACVSTLPLSG